MRKEIKIKPSCLFCAYMLITGWVTALYLKQTTTADVILIEIFFISFVGMSMPTYLGLRSSLNSQCLPKSWTNLIALAFGTGLHTRMHFHVEGMPVVLYLWYKLTWMLSMINEWQSKLHKRHRKIWAIVVRIDFKFLLSFICSRKVWMLQ